MSATHADLTLENGSLRITIDGASGGLRSMVDLTSGEELIPAATGRLFRLVVRRPDIDTAPVDGERQTAQVERVGDDAATIRYERLVGVDGRGDYTDLDIGVTIELRLDGRELRSRLSLDNRGADPITEIQFPLVSGWTGFGGPGVDEVTTGAATSSGRIDPFADNLSREVDTYTILGSVRRWEIPYPVRTATPWVDLSGGGRGFGVLAYMTKPRASGAVLRDHSGYDMARVMELGWYWNSTVKPGASWSTDEVGVFVHRGDWHETADRYHDWLLSWGWSPRIAPESFRRSLGMQNVVFQDFDGLRYRRFADLPAIVDEGKALGVVDVCVWDLPMLGYYTRLDERSLHGYDPDDLQELRDAIAGAKERGAQVSTLTNMRLVLPKSQWWADGGSQGVIRDSLGNARQEAWAVSSVDAGWWPRGRGPVSSVLCAKSSQFRELADAHLDALSDIGFNSMFLDQPFEESPCFDQSHGHADTGDSQQGVVDWVAGYRERFRPERHDGYIMGEFADPFTCAGIDVFWNWTNFMGRPDVVQYTFPEFAQVWVTDRSYRDALEGFLHGFQLAFVTRGLTGSLGRQDPEFASFVRELATLRSTTAEVTTLARFRDDRGLKVGEGLRAKRFERADGSAVVLVNHGAQPVSGEVRVDAAASSGVFTGMAGARGTAAGSTATVELPPNSALVWQV